MRRPRSSQERLAKTLALEATENPAPIFTDRELEILAELTKGNSNKVIARNLGIESNTVKFYLQNIYQKLGVNRRQLAITLAQRLSLLEPNAKEIQ
ncbi:MAG: LuxR C-terminal-related transcriptional regulator [Parvularculaceae bacterium]